MAQVLERAQEMLNPAEIMPRVIGRYSSLHIDHGKGIYVWDVNGERYADFTSGIAVVNTGHCHPHVVAAIQDQAAGSSTLRRTSWPTRRCCAPPSC
jgi:4-aminobutyrate aminotransferase-like enzyme